MPERLQHQKLQKAREEESAKFEEFYLWLDQAMPSAFFEEVTEEYIILISHALIGFHLQDYYTTLTLKNTSIVLCQESADADLRILENYSLFGIKHYFAYISKKEFPGTNSKLRVAFIHFSEAGDPIDSSPLTDMTEQLFPAVQAKIPTLTKEVFTEKLKDLQGRFLRALPFERLALAVEMYLRAETRDHCQYEVRYNEDWQGKNIASMQIVLAWRNAPKHNFLFRIARIVHRHGLVMKRVNATYIRPYEKDSILVMVLSVHGIDGRAAWDVAHLPEFLRELVTVKYFASFDAIDNLLVAKGVISGNMGNVLRAIVYFVQQCLVHVDANLYDFDNIIDALTRHPELTKLILEAFQKKFDPQKHDIPEFMRLREQFLKDVALLDTGQEEIDARRRTILLQAMNFVSHTLKTNAFRNNFTAFSFRLDPKYLDAIPFEREKKFKELPYAIFFFKGMHFFGFHIRFKDLSRGGLRTIYPKQPEEILTERNNVFTECYNLAYTQHLKNKDIPEGGSKGVILLTPFERLESEAAIYEKELELEHVPEAEIERKLVAFRNEQKLEYLYQSQRSFIESLITIVNCEPDGKLKAKYIVDYWKRPEYIYLGPDENMHDSMIEWIAQYSIRYGYKPKSAFISGKPEGGINHKHYGVTSLGVNVYMEEALRYLGIDPATKPFSVKMSGGPDGDVAGNQIRNLYRYYKDTARLLALTDVSGTIYDPEGLDLEMLNRLFHEVKPISYYPPELIHEQGFLVDRTSKKASQPFVQKTLLWRKEKGKIIEDWIPGNEANRIYRHNLMEVEADVFIPAGGRPRALSETNVVEFLNPFGKPTAKAIIEGANLYLTEKARRFLEEKGALVIKDSSANKTGVICSSFEVLSGLALGDALFEENKEALIKEILERLRYLAEKEAQLLFSTHKKTDRALTHISNEISLRINLFCYQILDYLESVELSSDPNDPLIACFLRYCPATLREKFQDKLLQEIPDHHKKAIVACQIAATTVYSKGLDWFPSIVEILPVLLREI